HLASEDDHDGQNDDIENLNEGSGDADQENCSEEGDRAGQDEVVTIVVDEEVQAATADKPKGTRRKRKATGGASGSNHPTKKLKEDHGTSSDGSASIGGRSLVANQDLFKHSTLNVEVGVAAAATVPFVTSSVTPTPECEGGDNTDSVSGPNLRTQHPSERFVISSDYSHLSSINVADAEVASIVRSPVPPPPVVNAAVTTTIISAPLPLRSLGRAPSQFIKAFLWIPLLYVRQGQIFQSVLDDPDVCRSVVDQLAPPGLFSQLHRMDYDQLFTEFNVGAARQTCLGAEVRMWLKHNLRERKILEGRCARQVDMLKEKDAEIANLKAQLSLKEAEAIEAFHLRN
ncbi:hypothetical protein Tco_1088056, partial [Tanacetum coccineum]